MAVATMPVEGCAGVVEALRIAEAAKDVVDSLKTADVAALFHAGEAVIWRQEAVASLKLRKTRCSYRLMLGLC